MSAKKDESAIDIVLNKNTSKVAMNKAIDKLWVESKGDFNYQCKEGYRFVDVLILKTLDYNNIGYSEKLISQFVKKHEKDFISIIENDVTEDNPIALIIKTRSSSVLLKQLLDKVNFSKKNIEANPGLKMLTTTFKSITPSHFYHPSDFILVLEEKLSKYDHIKKNVNELKAAYAISNLFAHKELNDEIKKGFSLISQNSLDYSNSLSNDLNPNQFYIKVINDGLNYINEMGSSEIDTLKYKVEKELICDLSIIDGQSLDIFNRKFNINIQDICEKLNLSNVKINMGYSGSKTLEEYTANLMINNASRALNTLIDINNIELNEIIIQEKVLAIKESCELEKFKTYIKELKNNNKQISINNYSFKKLEQPIDNIESLYEVNLTFKPKSKQIYNDTMSMEKLYMNISDPLVEDIFKKIEQCFKKNKISNFNIINQIAAIVELDGVFPNKDNVLKNINANCIGLLENKLVLDTNGEIIKNPALEDEKQALLSKQNKKLLDPLMHELKKINSLFKEVFIMVEEHKLEDKKSVSKLK